MAKKPGPDKGEGGRPPLRGLDTDKEWADFEKLCHIQCTAQEICAWYGLSEDTLSRRCKARYGKTFADVRDEKKQGGKISLRRSQFQKALANGGNVAMLIWLGKQYLSQSDLPKDIDSDGDVVFQSRIGPGGTVIQEIKAGASFEAKTFDAKTLLEEEADKKKPKKKSTSKKKAAKKKKTTKKQKS